MTSFAIPSDPALPSTVNYEGPRPRLDMTGDFYLWQQQIGLALQELKHIGSSSEPQHNFQQAMRALYSEGHFGAFISSRAWQQAGLDEQAAQEIQQLQQLLDSFEEPETDDLLATNPDWQVILAQTETVTALLLSPPRK